MHTVYLICSRGVLVNAMHLYILGPSRKECGHCNKTILRLTDLLLHYDHFFFQILNTFVLIIKQLSIYLQLIMILSPFLDKIYSEVLLYRVGHLIVDSLKITSLLGCNYI